MTYSVSELILIAGGYLLFLFLVAWVTEKGRIPARLVRHPAVFVFSLGVYASAWAIYGSVGYAHDYGYNFLAYFLGISGVFLLAPILLAPILRLTTTYQLSSLADLFAFRYRSRMAGALTTLMMVAGMLPLLSMQIKAVAESIQILTGEPDPAWVALWFCLLITLFAILFGARHATARERHEGLVVAIATESLIKVVAFVAVALIGLFGVFDGPGGLGQWLNAHPEMLSRLYGPLQNGTWHSLIMAFFVSAVVMPHMFHMAFTENLNPRALVTASWGLPLLFLVMALCVPLILWAALASNAPTKPDYFALGVGLANGGGAVLGYLAGLAGASGMLIVATLALSGMSLNHLVLPASPLSSAHDLYRNLLWTRRVLIGAILALAYGFYRLAGPGHSSVELGVLSFVAALQFVPGLIGTLFWPSGNRNGLFAGIGAGFLVWVLALLIPMVFPHWQLAGLAESLGLRPRQGMAHWNQVAIASLSLNGLIYAIVSIITPTSREERTAAEACAVDSLRRPYRWDLGAQTVDDFIKALSGPLGPVTAAREVDMALRDLRLKQSETRPYALRRLRDQLETNLSGLLGPSVAHQLMDDNLPYRPQEGESEDIQFIESRLEQYRDHLSGLAAELDSLRRFHRQTLLELPMGVISLGADGEIIGWNRAVEALTGIDAEDTIGSRLDHLPAPWGDLLAEFSRGKTEHDPQRQLEVDGLPRWLSLHRSRIHSPGPTEQAGGQVLVLEDITELRQMESHLAHNERLASIGRLAAGVAHEIGNPVTAIACLAQNLDGDCDQREQRQSAGQIVEQTRRINRIVESLVTFSHSGGVRDTIQGPVDLADTVREAIALLRLDPDHRGQRFDNLCPRGQEVKGDPQRLLQVFVNLLGNAADACADDQPIVVSCERDGERLRVRVEDLGHGVPAELRDALFEPFVTSKPPGRGTGLGLALVYSIIEDHRGTVRVESPIADGHGTRFVIELPVFAGHRPSGE
ncbi:sensor histidine kinase [Alloalcanivorax profundimaris]|uniref:sensor histidine kinase n=1 Tax=Alloalcanivorax profundimaris TaxID=2735259 RepID=UPI0018897334|nr:sensor histidine kinase [Alloalcanivorax profundimaris]MBF1802036.1 PAS domain S-box protein [Alloalcanivorax profundimaris]